MIEPRLASGIQISAIKRLAEAQGDIATVLNRGDANSGAILLIGLVRGGNPVMYERYPSLNGVPVWQVVKPGESDAAVDSYWKKRCERDPDLWVLELDVASAARFDGLLTALN